MPLWSLYRMKSLSGRHVTTVTYLQQSEIVTFWIFTVPLKKLCQTSTYELKIIRHQLYRVKNFYIVLNVRGRCTHAHVCNSSKNFKSLSIIAHCIKTFLCKIIRINIQSKFDANNWETLIFFFRRETYLIFCSSFPRKNK